MATHLTQWEQETVINFNRESKGATVYTADPVMMRKMDALCEEQPDIFSVTNINYYMGTEEVCSKSYAITDKKRVKIMKKREFTEEELAELQTRGRKLAELSMMKRMQEKGDNE